MIGLSKKNKDAWDRFVLSVRQGATPQVKSEDRRNAVLAVSDFVDRYQANSVYFCHEAKINTSIQLGSAGLSLEQREKGYAATICAMIQSESIDGDSPAVFQDLHVTKIQLKQIAEAIKVFLEDS